MAVDNRNTTSGQHWAVGANVGVMIALAIVLAGALQYMAYRWSSRADLSTSGVNSLTDATASLLGDLDEPVVLTSLYFKTDLEDEDQDRYRSAMWDLLNLYRSTNRSKISVEQINPLQDHEQRKQLFKDLLELPKFKEEAAGHIDVIRTFREEMLPQISELLASELQALEAFTALAGQDDRLVGQVRELYARLQREVEGAARDIADAMASEVPLYGGATGSIRQIGAAMKQVLDDIINVGDQIMPKRDQYSPAVADFFIEASVRYGPLLATLTELPATIDALPQLSFDDVVRDLLADTGNALLVRTSRDACVVPFRSVWPPIDPRMTGSNEFKNRKFQGEQKVTSAILQLTQVEKPAVIFVRHGGPPLLMGGFMPGQPGGAYERMRDTLEDANFSVHEWDLATEDDPPAIDPEPTERLFVVLRPMPSPPSMPGQPPQSPPFTPQKLAVLKAAMGENPKAIFIAGFMPGFAMGISGMAAPYEYADYLRESWGLDAPCDRVLLAMEQFAIGKFRFVRTHYPLHMVACQFADHPMTAELGKTPAAFPLVSPMELVEPAPEGVSLNRLVWLPESEGLWSVQDVSYYVKQQANEYITRAPDDFTGEFLMGAAATTDKGRVVVISSSDFASDEVALAQHMVLTSQGLSVRPRNPGNAALFMNGLHWLNDNIKWMNLGTPIDTSTLAVQEGSGSMKFVWALTVFILPALAMCGGICVWFVRRR
jgi:hypothetical protein